MVKVISEKGDRKEATLGWRKLVLRTYALGIDTKYYENPEDAKRDVCGICYMGECKKKGTYFSLEDKRACDGCSTDMTKKHSEAKKNGTEFNVEVETTRKLAPALTVFSNGNLEDKEELRIKF